MEKWEKLISLSRLGLQRGDLVKFPAAYPFEEVVVMMVCEGASRDSNRTGMITVTGFKAGINPYVIFPDECGGDGERLKTQWLIENWGKWVWPEGDVSNVLVRERLNACEL